MLTYEGATNYTGLCLLTIARFANASTGVVLV